MSTYDAETGELLDLSPMPSQSLALQQHETAMMDVAVATAQKLGRSIKQFQADLESWCCHSKSIAAACTYVLPRSGKKIVGPSIRFAELLQASYRHVVVDCFIEEEGPGHITVCASATDLFRVISRRSRIRRNITDRNGKRFNADMIAVTAQAASAIAIRNAIIAVIPRALWEDVWLKSREVAQGHDESGKLVKPFAERLADGFTYLASFGATEDQVLAYLGKPSRKDLDADDLLAMQQQARAIKAGEVDVDDAFKPRDGNDGTHGRSTASGTEAAERLAKAAAERVESREKAAETPKPATRKRRAPPPEEQPEEEPPAEEPPAADEGVPDIDL